MLLGALSPISARADDDPGLKLCNVSDKPLRVSVVTSKGELFQSGWRLEGWFDISPSRCHLFENGGFNAQYYFSILEQSVNGPQIMDFGVEEIPEFHWTSATYGVELFLCIPEGEIFDRVAQHWGSRNCGNNSYLQLFNLHAFVERTTEFTVPVN